MKIILCTVVVLVVALATVVESQVISGTDVLNSIGLIKGDSGCGLMISGIDYNGGDLGGGFRSGVQSASECQNKCTELSACKFFTYNPSTNNCYLKGAFPNVKISHHDIGGQSC